MTKTLLSKQSSFEKADKLLLDLRELFDSLLISLD